MAKKKTSISVTAAKKSKHSVQWVMPFTKTNYFFFGGALAVIVLGYLLMATGITSDPQKYLETWANPLAIVVAPTLLVLAYCVLIPLAIMRRDAPNTEEQA